MEGYLSYENIFNVYSDLSSFFVSNYSEQIINYQNTQLSWINSQISANPQDLWWQLVNATVAELQGMYQGYLNATNGNQSMYLTWTQFYSITYQFEFGDVATSFSDAAEQNIEHEHCSFLLRLTNESLFVSHTTWDNFVGIYKTYKVLDYYLWNPMVTTGRMTYSSFPGSLPSGDDWYILDNNIVVTETTIVSDNASLYEWIHPDSVPYWIRINVANMVYQNQSQWAEVYFTQRSGTYNNQWLVVDFNNYWHAKNNISAAQNIIWMVEEFYSLTSAQDVTQELLIPQGYVASYNVPYNQTLWNVSENPTTYTNDPRAILFAKYAPGIQTIQQHQYTMRLNNISDTGDYCQAIAARCDLQTNSSFPFGACDCKVTSDFFVGQHQALIIDGPTSETVPPFNWEDWPQYQNNRVGMPSFYNFSWVFLDPYQNFTSQLPKDNYNRDGIFFTE